MVSVIVASQAPNPDRARSATGCTGRARPSDSKSRPWAWPSQDLSSFFIAATGAALPTEARNALTLSQGADECSRLPVYRTVSGPGLTWRPCPGDWWEHVDWLLPRVSARLRSGHAAAPWTSSVPARSAGLVDPPGPYSMRQALSRAPAAQPGRTPPRHRATRRRRHPRGVRRTLLDAARSLGLRRSSPA